MPTITKRIVLESPDSFSQDTESRVALAEAAEVLRRSGLVAFPTETVYGLGANALDAAAVAGIFAAKQRPAWDPLIVHIASWEMLERVVAEVSPQARSLMRAFWPGPLTLLLPRSARVPDAVTAGRPLVAVRWPQHPVAQALILAADMPLAAPSANLFGHVSPTTAAHVLADLDGRIAMVLDGGATTLGLESAVLDPNTTPPTLYRPGTLDARQIEAVIGPVQSYVPPAESATHEAQPSPGVELRHYAPRARVLLVESEAELLAVAASAEGKVGVLLPDAWTAPPSTVVFAWGDWSSPVTLAQRLYAGLRWLDEQNVDVIVCPLPPEGPLTYALRDRILKAARSKL